MSAPDIAGLVGVAIIVAGILAMAVSALALLFPKKRQDFASPADEWEATFALNNRSSFSMSGPMIGAWPSGEVPGEKTQNAPSA